jgi:hypothetical protein
MGKFKEMDLLRQEREAFDADYPLPPPPHWGDLWVAWNSEDGFTFWEDEQQAIRWSAADSNEYPVQYVMQKAQLAPWVGLTDEEVAAAWPCELGSMEKRFARTIEAKLKEKNRG